jgi:hypothetical protein
MDPVMGAFSSIQSRSEAVGPGYAATVIGTLKSPDNKGVLQGSTTSIITHAVRPDALMYNEPEEGVN